MPREHLHPSPNHKSLKDYVQKVYDDYESWLKTDQFTCQEFTDFQDSLDEMFKQMGLLPVNKKEIGHE